METKTKEQESQLEPRSEESPPEILMRNHAQYGVGSVQRNEPGIEIRFYANGPPSLQCTFQE